MSYYTALGLTHEPFSTSPDPSFFFQSSSHFQALNRLEIGIRLRRGLSLVLGDVGTGKTTLARRLLSNFAHEEQFVFHMILDPSFGSEYQFLMRLCRMFGIDEPMKSTLDCRDALENYLYHENVHEGRTTVLLVDEGQKLSVNMLENLRMLLNYETNQYKLLQLVIFGQLELLDRLTRIRNFMDRVSLKYLLNPLDAQETAELIRHRLHSVGCQESEMLFSDDALQAVYEITQGYPRKIGMLCHDALEQLVMRDQRVVDANLIQEIIQHESGWDQQATYA